MSNHLSLEEFARLTKSLPKEKESGCQIWQGGFWSNGYPRVNVEGITRGNRAALTIKLKRRIRSGYLALHRCDNPACVRLNHLWEGTHKDNMKDMVKKGRSFRPTGPLSPAIRSPHTRPRGEKHGMAKLTPQQVQEIRDKWLTGRYYQRELAVEYGTSQPHVSGIVSRAFWSHT